MAALARLTVSIIFFLTIFFGSVPQIACQTQPYKVGMILPLSGGLAPMGEAFRKGVSLFSLEHPETGTSLQFLFEDSQYDGKVAVAALRKFTAVDKVDLTVVWGNTPSGACAPVAESVRIPLLAVSMNPEAKGRTSVITFGPKIELLIQKIAEKLKAWNLQNPAAVSIDIGSALKGVSMLQKELNGNLVVKTVANEERDFRTLIALLRSQSIDGLLLFLMPEQAMTFARQAVELNYHPKIVGGDIFAEDSFQKRFAQELPELAFVYGAVTPEFIATLRERWGDASYFYESASGYSIAAMIARLGIEARGQPSSHMLQGFKAVPLDNLPVQGLRLLEDQEYGWHFENDARAY